MEVRNVQRTGKMHYVYLPTSWCRKFKVNSDTKISIAENSDGSLIIAPEVREKTPKSIDLTLPSNLKETLINLIMACYVNPTSSFKIKMEKKGELNSLLKQKNFMAGLEFVELDGEHVTYEASMDIKEPDSLLKTMIKKIKNLLFVMNDNFNQELINKYEEEIDRSKIMIQKSVISALVQNEPTTLKPIDMYYTAQMAIELERLTDLIIHFSRDDKRELRDVSELIDFLKDVLENLNGLDYLKGATYAKKVLSIREEHYPAKKRMRIARIKRHLQNISELLLDWAISKKIED